MERRIDQMVTRRPVLPGVPLCRKDQEQHRPPVITVQARAGYDILAEHAGYVLPVLNVLVVQNKIIVIPEHPVAEGVGVNHEAADKQHHSKKRVGNMPMPEMIF